ncbi:MAG: cell division protein FtsQ/DivIB [Bacteroides sp.]|nr:cell division protein FtsQ/DivIB [Bacteroides sp.]
MIKRVFLLISMLLIVFYLGIAMTAFNTKPAERVCDDMMLIIKDSINAGFITSSEISTMLRKEELDPVGKPLHEINASRLEEVLNEHPLIDHAECYKTPSSKICVEVTQRVPILRIMSQSGENYYIDDKGKIMPARTKVLAHLPIVTGYIEKSLATRNLYNFGVFLQNDKFWNAQIEQIYINSRNEVELVPRVGDHTIFLGKFDNYKEKLERLRLFYEKALGKVGWNKYSRISVEFSNQIICTKREENR